MNNELEIRRALIRAIKGLSLGIPIALENTEFEEPEEGSWLEVFLLPSGRDSMGKNLSSSDEYTGVYQVSIWSQLYTGIKEPTDIANAIDKALPHGKTLSSNGVELTISKTEVRQGFRTGGYWQTPVHITFTSYIERT